MKPNRWSLVLASAGLVTVPAALLAEEQPQAQPAVLTQLASTTLSGYVDTSAQWNFGTGNANNPPYTYGGANKADGFNLDVVDLALDKLEDDATPWAAGYHVELWLGPDAASLGTQSTGLPDDFAIRQAYITLRTPIGNNIEWKIGVFDSILGYESFSSPNNPNYTRSYGFTIEPSQHTGVLASYKFCDAFSASAGVANTYGPEINGRANIESYKTYMGLVTFTCPTNWSWLSGSTLSVGGINGFNGNDGEGNSVRETSFYAGANLNTPISQVKVGASVDYADVHNASSVEDGGDGTTWAWDLYTTWQITEKLALNLRGEYVYLNGESLDFGNVDISEIAGANHIEAVTATAQYDLWKNVLTRVEFRWDHIEHGEAFGGSTPGSPDRANAYMLAANIIYKF